MAILGTGAATTKLSQVTPQSDDEESNGKIRSGKILGEGSQNGGGEGVFMKLTFSEKS